MEGGRSEMSRPDRVPGPSLFTIPYLFVENDIQLRGFLGQGNFLKAQQAELHWHSAHFRAYLRGQLSSEGRVRVPFAEGAWA
jgi:hypothetical protein